MFAEANETLTLFTNTHKEMIANKNSQVLHKGS